MMRLLALRRALVTLLISAGLALFSWYAMDIWHGSGANSLPDHDYLQEVTALRQQGKDGEALTICNYVKGEPGLPNRDAIVAIGTQIEAERASWFGKCKRFSNGFFMGDMNSMEGMAGTVVSDFLIIGDIRDLGQQGYDAATGKEVDPLIVALSTAGLAGSIAAWIPEPGEPAVAAADTGISLLKGLRKINALTGHFAGEIGKVIKRGLSTGKVGKLGEMFSDLGSMAKAAPAGTLGTAMKHVETVEDLRSISRCVKMAPTEATVALTIGGRSAAEWMKATGEVTSAMMKKALRKGVSGLAKAKPWFRGGKFLYRGRLGEMRQPLIDWFTAHTGARTVLFWLGIGSLLLSVTFILSSAIEFVRAFRPPELAQATPATAG